MSGTWISLRSIISLEARGGKFSLHGIWRFYKARNNWVPMWEMLGETLKTFKCSAHLSLIQNPANRTNDTSCSRTKHLLHSVFLQSPPQVSHGQISLRHFKLILPRFAIVWRNKSFITGVLAFFTVTKPDRSYPLASKFQDALPCNTRQDNSIQRWRCQLLL